MFALWYIVFGVAAIGVAAFIVFISKEEEWCAYVFATCLFALLFLIPISICSPLEAKKEVREYLYNKNIIEESLKSIQGDDDYLTLTGDVLEYNNWLVMAKSSRDTYGRWSVYYGLVEDLEPIKIYSKTEEKEK